MNESGIKKPKLEVIYSMAVLVMVPVLIVVNTLFITTQMRNNLDAELRRKADLSNTIFATQVAGVLGDDNKSLKLQSMVDTLQTARPDLSDIEVAQRIDGQWATIASSNSARKGKIFGSAQHDIVSQQRRSVARLINITDPQGNEAEAWYVVSPVQDSIGNMIGVVGYAHLLDKQKELNQTMTDFLSVATHELKAPMTVIKGNLSNALDGLYGKVEPKLASELEQTIAQTERLNNLVQDLLNVSRIEKGTLSFDMKSVDAGEQLAAIVERFSSRAAEKQLELSNTVPKNGVHISVDIGRFEEIFTNLIDNAIKYTEKGTVTLKTREEKDYVVLSVRDTGFGISAEDRKQLFRRFYRVRNEQTKGISGTGLGLWIIRQYIEKMGGKIEVESMVGTGTEFSVWFKKA
jgi:signal transduction histidine kinase